MVIEPPFLSIAIIFAVLSLIPIYHIYFKIIRKSYVTLGLWGFHGVYKHENPKVFYHGVMSWIIRLILFLVGFGFFFYKYLVA